MPPQATDHWTASAPKWVAISVLGAAGVAGLAWTMLDRVPPSADQGAVPLRNEPSKSSPAPPSEVGLSFRVDYDPASESSLGIPEKDLLGGPGAADAEGRSLGPPLPGVAPIGRTRPKVRVQATDANAPSAKTAPDSQSPDTNTKTHGLRIDLNLATAQELQLLPGIGPVLAQRIIEDRARNGPFRSVDDLDRVRGVGPRTLERLAPHLTAGP